MATLSLYSCNYISFPHFSPLQYRRRRRTSNCALQVNTCDLQFTASYGRHTEKAAVKEQQSIKLDSYSCGRLLQRYAKMKSIVEGKKLHAHMIKTGLPMDIFMENTLANMYAKCGFLDYARQVFDRMYERNAVSWTTMIAGYAQNWQGEEALELYRMMLREQLKPNQFTFASVLRACANLASAEHGKQVHAHVIKLGFVSDVTMGNALITMYSKCGNVENALNVFDGMSERDKVSWSALIAGCAQNGHGDEAQNLFSQMQWEGVESDKHTFSTVLVCCSGLEGLELGKQVHSSIIKMDFESDTLLESTLVTMYTKCDAMESAHKLFDQMLELDVVTWTAMIAGYARSGHGEESLKLFRRMLRSGTDPDSFSFTSVLGVCANLAIVNQGRQFHAQAIKRGLELDISVGSALITMYAKCSCIVDAREVFEKMSKPDVISWTAMIAGYALHGLGKEAFQLFEQMQSAGIKPDHITFVGLLSACSHVGLVDEGRKYFDSMSRDYGIAPIMEHYACIVDQLGRAGHLDEAEGIINEMPFEPSAFVWGIFLSACRTHGNMKLGKRAAEQLLELEPKESAPYVLLSNIYAMENRWDDVSKVRKNDEIQRGSKRARSKLDSGQGKGPCILCRRRFTPTNRRNLLKVRGIVWADGRRGVCAGYQICASKFGGRPEGT